MVIQDRDRGFTLIELLVSISISIIIIGALSTALIAFYKNGAYTSRRDDHSAGAHLLSAYLDRDLASAQQTSGNTCSGQPTGTGTSILLQLEWTEYTASNAAPTPVPGAWYYVNYVLATDNTTNNPTGGARKQLERWICSPTDSAANDHEILITDLASADAQVGTTTAAATASDCAGDPVVTVTVAPYETDAVPSYNYSGCVGSRLG